MKLITLTFLAFFSAIGADTSSHTIEVPASAVTSQATVAGLYSQSADSGGSWGSRETAISMAKTRASNKMYAHARAENKSTRNRSYSRLAVTWTGRGYEAEITVHYDLN